nr:MAG TPA: hypothetical protein [Myoviridae sp. ct3tv2]DAR21246.1 MAG TPA: hypothetical protein [Caudoviricetes sp.]
MLYFHHQVGSYSPTSFLCGKNQLFAQLVFLLYKIRF